MPTYMDDTTGNDGSSTRRLLKAVAHVRSRLAPGTTLSGGRFIIKQLLGSGGMGDVYKAFDNDCNDYVALKILSCIEPDGIYRFKQEFRSLVNVVHPNLVGLRELLPEGDQWFFTMDLVPGDTLLIQLNSEPNEANLRRVFAQFATGVQAIHDAGKLHRDLKPNNVFMTPVGNVVILDFGLVSDLEEGGIGQTVVDNGISGTPIYMAPEQAAAKPATAASDWYAFGAILFEALTGRPPFVGQNQTVLMRKQKEDAPKPSSLRPGIPEGLEHLCLGLLRRNPLERPGHQEIIQVLEYLTTEVKSLVSRDETPFVGRDQELTELKKAFEATDKGSPVVMFVHGESGIGKSTLIERFLRELQKESKAVVLSGRCYERESIPFRGCDSLIDALSRHLRKLPEGRASRLIPRHIHELAKLFPAIARLDIVNQVKQRIPLPAEPFELRRRAFLALREIFAVIAEQEPLVLYVDDLQWSDVDGAKLLASLFSPPAPPPLLFIGSYRSEDVNYSDGLSTIRERVTETKSVERREIALSDLNKDESYRLALELLPKEAQIHATRIAEASQGIPFFILEFARHAATGQVEIDQIDFKNVIGRRLMTLSETERRMLETICVSARPVEQSFLRAATDTNDLASILRFLLGQKLIKNISGPIAKVTSYHDRIREAVVANIETQKLKKYHTTIAETIKHSTCPDLVALTQHLLNANILVEAGNHAERAAIQALDNMAFEQAAAMYRLVLDHADLSIEKRIELQISLAESLIYAGRAIVAGKLFLKSAAEVSDNKHRGDLRCRGAMQLLLGGQVDEGIKLLRIAFTDYGMDFDGLARQDLLKLHLRLNQRGIDFQLRDTHEIDPAILHRLEMLLAAAKGLALINEDSHPFRMEHRLLALDVGEIVHVGDALTDIVVSEAVFIKETIPAFFRLSELAEQSQNPYLLSNLAVAEGAIAYYSGRPKQAVDNIELAENIILQRCVRKSKDLDLIRVFLLTALHETGDNIRLGNKVDFLLEDAKNREDLFLSTFLKPYMALYWLGLDQPEKARQLINEVVTPEREKTNDVSLTLGILVLALCDMYEGKISGWDHFQQYARQFQGLITTFIPLEQCRLYRHRCTFALALADKHPERDQLLGCAEKDIEALKNIRSTYQIAIELPNIRPYVPLYQAGMAAVKGDRQTASSLLDDALELFESEETNRLARLCALRRKGQLLDGSEGAELVRHAENELTQLSIKNIPRFCVLFTPGFDSIIDEKPAF